jgi:hypothetical protein
VSTTTQQQLVQDRLWELIEPLLPPQPTPRGPGGRPRVEERAALESGQQPAQVHSDPTPRLHPREPPRDQLHQLVQRRDPPGKIDHAAIITARRPSAFHDTPNRRCSINGQIARMALEGSGASVRYLGPTTDSSKYVVLRISLLVLSALLRGVGGTALTELGSCVPSAGLQEWSQVRRRTAWSWRREIGRCSYSECWAGLFWPQ